MSKCRTDNPAYHQPDNFFSDEPEIDVDQRVVDFWTWAEADSTDSTAIFQCAIDSLVDDKADWNSFFIAITLAVDDGKFPELKEHMEKYIRADVEAGNDTWA